MRNLLDLRFGIRTAEGLESSLWRLWIARAGDVYLAVRSHAGVSKYSFHRSGICRSAFTAEHGTPRAMTDRAMFKWRRSPTPPRGVGTASRVAWLIFPTDFLSRPRPHKPGDVLWIPAAPANHAAHLELCYTSETQDAVVRAFEKAGHHRLVSFTDLTDGDAFFMSCSYGRLEPATLVSPAARGSVFPDLLFSPDDPTNSGRPIRIILGPTPKDGDALVLFELGGRPSGAGSELPAGTAAP